MYSLFEHFHPSLPQHLARITEIKNEMKTKLNNKTSGNKAAQFQTVSPVCMLNIFKGCF